MYTGQMSAMVVFGGRCPGWEAKVLHSLLFASRHRQRESRRAAMMDFVISISLTALDQDVCGSKARRNGASSRRNAGSEMGI